MTQFWLNNSEISTDFAAGGVLLDLLREERRLRGTRETCREGDCGACMVLCGQVRDGAMHYRPVNSCLLPVGSLEGQHIVTIEGLSRDDAHLSPIQEALIEHGAIQCGYCTPGLVMGLTAFFLSSDNSHEKNAIDAIGGNLCRCTGYAGIKRAVRALCEQFDLSAAALDSRLHDLIQWRILPPYFASVIPANAGIQENALNRPLLDSRVRGNDVGQDGATTSVAGGTDLWVQQPDPLRNANVKFLPRQDRIDAPPGGDKGTWTIGATTSIEALRCCKELQHLLPHIEERFKLIASTPIRQQASIGGNIVNASPIGDMSIFFLALDASITLQNDARSRTLPLRKLFKGYKKLDLHDDEFITEIHFEANTAPLRFNFEKVSKRTHLDIASVNSAMLLSLDGDVVDQVHLAAGGVAPIPLYLEKTCAFIQGKAISADMIEQSLAVAQSEVQPIDDIRGSAAYKRLLLEKLMLAHWLELAPDAFDSTRFH